MRLRVFLSAAEDQMLLEMRRAEKVPQRVKDRATIIRMNARGDYVETIAAYFNCHVKTVRNTLNRWIVGGVEGLREAPGRGKKAQWQEADLVYLEKALVEDERTYNSAQLSKKLEQERQISLSPGHLRRVLKKRG